jgi:hypothetical protein
MTFLLIRMCINLYVTNHVQFRKNKRKLEEPFTDLFSRRFDSTNFELAGLLAHLTFCGLPVAMNRNSGGECKKFSSRLTAAGTAPVSHRIPFSDLLPEKEARQPGRRKSREKLRDSPYSAM